MREWMDEMERRVGGLESLLVATRRDMAQQWSVIESLQRHATSQIQTLRLAAQVECIARLLFVEGGPPPRLADWDPIIETLSDIQTRLGGRNE